MKKVLAGFLYVAYSAFIIFAICFASTYYSDIYNLMNGNIADITDVEMTSSTQGEMMPGKQYNFKYTVIGEYKSNAGLRFESLDPDKMSVTSKGAVRGIDNGEDGDYITARMRIYSTKDEDFEKIVTLTFKRVYPESFKANYYVHSVGTNSSKVYLGFPIYLYSSPASGQTYSVKTYDLVYDSEYFRYEEESGLLIPIKATADGEKITIGVRYANGASAESKEFAILEAPKFEGFDEIRLNGNAIENFSIKQKASIALTYYKDGKKQVVHPTITFTDGEEGYINSYGKIVFKTPGEKHITLSVGDEYTRDITISVKNVISLPDMPDLDDELYEDNTISIDYYDTLSFMYTFDKSTTYRTMKYEYDKKVIKVSVSSGKITITPKDIGETKLKIYIDDGHERVEREFTVKVTGSKTISDKIDHFISTNSYKIVSKVFGHMLLFAILAPICLLLAKTFEFESVLKDILFMLMTSLPLAALTEFIQSFVPGRFPRYQDVLIDMSGLLIGTVLTFLIFKIAKKSTNIGH